MKAFEETPPPFSPRPIYSDNYPLDEFYAARGEKPGVINRLISRIEAAKVPEPYRSLLVHKTDMTSTLEKFHGETLHIEVLARHVRENQYYREVVLVLDHTKKRVEFGAIKIILSLFPPEAQEEILRERQPLGRILNTFNIAFSSRPVACLRLEPDKFIRTALHLEDGPRVILYGRRNTLLDAWEQPLAEIVANSAALITMPNDNSFDAIIIGAGPAGSSSAAILAAYGHRVLILEREKFPRYHIGESLLPFTFQPLQRLGLIDKMRASAFVKKYSVQFVSPSGKASQPFYFFDRYDRDTVAQTWQVLRSEFDQMLLDHAREKGALVREETAVKELIKEDGRVIGVRAQTGGGPVAEYRAPITLDCSGKEAFCAVRNHWRTRDPGLNKIAVWTYYEGAQRDEGIDAGATTVAYVPEKGWFWYIPQHNDRISVGVVAEGKYLTRGGVKAPEEIFQREIGENQWIKQHLACGRQTGQYFLTSEYTHHSRHCGMDGLLLVGDAFAFLDPVFSSGVMLALKSGTMAGEEVHKAIIERDFSPARFVEYGRLLRQGVENMRKLVYAFYDPKFSFRKLTDKYPDAVGSVTDCLSGDVNKDFSRLWSQIGEFAPLPESLPLGEPLLNPPIPAAR